jgi:transcription antitermination factor NusA-like protein
MVKVLICSFCAKTGTLCTNCSSRLKRGEISNLDVQSSQVLTKLEKKFTLLSKSKLKQTISTDDLVILVVDKNLKDAFEQHPEINSTLQKELRKSVETVLLENSIKETLSSLFQPLEVLGVDQIFVPDGTKELKIRLNGSPSLLSSRLELIKTIAEKVTNSLIRVEFTQQ